MNLLNFGNESHGSKRSWSERTRRSMARSLMRFGLKGAKWAEKLALWIDPSLAAIDET
jgi:hypothetical protein